MTENRSIGEKVIYDGYKVFEARRIEHTIFKQVLRYKTRPRSRTILILNTLVTSAVECIWLQTDMLVIWDFMTTNNRWFILQSSFRSILQLIHIIWVTKYVDLQMVWEAIWEDTGLMPTSRTVFFLLVTYATGLARIKLSYGATCVPTYASCRSEAMAFFCEVVVAILVYIYIYVCVCVCVSAHARVCVCAYISTDMYIVVCLYQARKVFTGIHLLLSSDIYLQDILINYTSTIRTYIFLKFYLYLETCAHICTHTFMHTLAYLRISTSWSIFLSSTSRFLKFFKLNFVFTERSWVIFIGDYFRPKYPKNTSIPIRLESYQPLLMGDGVLQWSSYI